MTVVGLLGDDGRPAGVRLETPKRVAQRIRARLVVGADGRGSTVARLARVLGRVRAHNRFYYFAYWRGIEPRTTRARLWFLDPDGAAAFPNEDDLTVVVAAPHRSRLRELRAEPEEAYRRMVAALPDGPDVAHAERASKLMGKLEVPLDHEVHKIMGKPRIKARGMGHVHKRAAVPAGDDHRAPGADVSDGSGRFHRREGD